MELLLVIAFILAVLYAYKTYAQSKKEFEEAKKEKEERKAMEKENAPVYDPKTLLARALNGQTLNEEESAFLADYIVKLKAMIEEAIDLAADAYYSPFTPRDFR